ncbi:MAG: hypothetical protein EXR75_02650 [Myxococcales bacterium]|nr:hypothetical protein [Myxococcales bacterium]
MLDSPGDERQRARDETVSLVHEILVKLDKTLRARRLYSPGHPAIASFADELSGALKHYLRSFGALRLRIRPTSFELGDRVIDGAGLDELALGFFRRGVLALRIDEFMSDAELDIFIDVINRGFFSHNAADEDLLTLLWRANLSSLKYSAVLGYTEDDGSGDAADGLLVDSDTIGDALGDDAGSFDVEAMSAELRAAFAEKFQLLKGKDEQLPKEVVALRKETELETEVILLERLLTLTKATLSLRDRESDLPSDGLTAIFTTLRRGFLEGGDIEALAKFAQAVQSLSENVELSPGDQAAVQAVLQSGLNERQLTSLIKAAPGGAAKHAAALAFVVKVFAHNDPEFIARLADQDASDDGRAALNQMLGDVTGQDPDYLVKRFRSLEGERAIEALRLLANQNVAAARMAVAVRLPAVGDEFQIELLEAVRSLPGLYDARIRSALVRLAEKGGTLRTHILESYVLHPDPEVTSSVLGWVTGKEIDGWDSKSLEAAFKVLLRAHEAAVFPVAERILERKSLFRRRPLLELKLAVIASLAVSDTTEAHAILERQLTSRDDELRRAARTSLDQRALDHARSRHDSHRGESQS